MTSVRMSCLFFFFKQKTAYEMRISDWSSDVCSSDLGVVLHRAARSRADLSVHLVDVPPVVGPVLIGADQGDRDVGERGPAPLEREIGRASCRERVCQYV